MLVCFQGDKGYIYIPYDYMCNPQYCQDLHTIQSVSNCVNRREKPEIPYTHGWNTSTNIGQVISTILHDSDSSDQSLWELNNYFDFYNTHWQNGHIIRVPCITASSHNGARGYTDRVSAGNNSVMSYIFWIDDNIEENAHVVKQLADEKCVEVDFLSDIVRGRKSNHLHHH